MDREPNLVVNIGNCVANSNVNAEDTYKEMLQYDFCRYKSEIVYLIEAICQYSTKCRQKHFLGINMKYLRKWGGINLPDTVNPYLNEPMSELVVALYMKMQEMESYYTCIVVNNKLNGMIVPIRFAEYFQSVFEMNYPFKLSFDDLLHDFAKLKVTIIKYSSTVHFYRQ